MGVARRRHLAQADQEVRPLQQRLGLSFGIRGRPIQALGFLESLQRLVPPPLLRGEPGQAEMCGGVLAVQLERLAVGRRRLLAESRGRLHAPQIEPRAGGSLGDASTMFWYSRSAMGRSRRT